MSSNGEIKIEKGVPLPSKGRYVKFPWNKLEVGDSFFVAALNKNDSVKTQSRLHTSLRDFQRYGGEQIKIQTTQVDGGVRVWRIE